MAGGISGKMRVPTTADLMSMWNASGLKEKLIFTFAMLVLFRLGIHLPLFGINNEYFSNLASQNNILGFLDLFSGGALGKVSIFALGIGPYITSSIIMQLLAVIIPALERLQKEDGEAGRRKISQYTRLFTVALAAFQGIIFMSFMSHTNAITVSNHVMFYISSVLTLTAGSILVMWMSELITEKGIGNGGSLIIFVGILSGIPLYSSRTAQMIAGQPSLMWNLMLLLAIFFVTMVFIVVMQEAVRKVIIVNPKRQVGNKVYGGVNTFIPFKLNPGGVMPIIFAVAILLFPSTILSLVGQANIPAGWVQDFIVVLNKVFNPKTKP